MQKYGWKILQYALSLTLAVGLMSYAFQGVSLAKVWQQSKEANFSWVVISVLFALLSHLSRAYRWNMLLKPLGYSPTLTQSFLSVMNGYFINLILPRAGEVSRCGFMQKMGGVPLSIGFGTLVLERLVDVLMLLLLIIGLLLVEFQNYATFFEQMILQKLLGLQQLPWAWLIGVGVFSLAVGLLFIYRFKDFIQKSVLYVKIREFLKKLLSGVLSIRKVQNKSAFFFHTIFIWLMYYGMAYVLLFSFESTSNLSLWAGYVLLVMGAVGMAAPVQGGFGVYHTLVSSLLMTYGLQKEEGIIIATFLHTAQTLVVIIFGGLSLLLSTIIIQQHKKYATDSTQNHGLAGSPTTSENLAGKE